jgi:hypothetical protein
VQNSLVTGRNMSMQTNWGGPLRLLKVPMTLKLGHLPCWHYWDLDQQPPPRQAGPISEFGVVVMCGVAFSWCLTTTD